MYFMYFNFSIFHSLAILLFPTIYCKLFNIPLFTLYNTTDPLFQSLHYTLFHYKIIYYSTIYNTTTLLYNNLLFQLLNPLLYKLLLFTIYSYRSITLQSLIVFNTCSIVNTRLFAKNFHVFQFPSFSTLQYSTIPIILLQYFHQ